MKGFFLEDVFYPPFILNSLILIGTMFAIKIIVMSTTEALISGEKAPVIAQTRVTHASLSCHACALKWVFENKVFIRRVTGKVF